MKKTASLLLLVGVLLFVAYQSLKTDACDPVTSRLVAQAYVLSIPLMGQEDDLLAFMTSLPTYFIGGGKAIQCMQSLGNTLVKKGMSNQFSSQTAMRKFGGRMPAGLEGLPGKVDQDLSSFGASSIIIGHELLWLSDVLPPAVQGNPTRYNTTATPARRSAREPLQPLCQQAPLICQMMQAELRAEAPSIENQIYALAVQ